MLIPGWPPVGRRRRVGGRVLVARLGGGLGNQLFMYSAAYSLAAATGRECQIDCISGFHGDPYERKFQLEYFEITAKRYEGPFSRTGIKGRILRAAARRHNHLLESRRRYWFPEAPPQEVLGAMKQTEASTVVLEGFFQDARFFKHMRDSLMSELRLRSCDRLEGAEPLLQKAEGEHVVAVHIRGNHGVSASGKVVGLANRLDKAYYKGAVEYALSQDPAAEFLIFSDGARPCDYLPLNKMRVLNEGLPSQSDIADFTAMRRCRHHIIANSTFSWWAAWLKGEDRGFVVSPPVEQFGFPIAIPGDWRTIATHASTVVTAQ